MKKPGLTLLAAVLSCTALAGCGASKTTSPYLQSTARAFLVAQTYDRGDHAVREENSAKLEESVAKLRKLGAVPEALTLAMRVPPTEAEEEVAKGTRNDMLAQLQTGEAKDNLTKRATAHYRKALQLQPDFNSPDPIKLNSLGYFLADRGSTESDFKLAETLTRRSLLLIDELVDANAAQGSDTKALISFRSAVRDSVAWALYRQGRFAEALKEQQLAVKEAKDVDKSVSAELNEHLRLILKVSSQKAESSKLE